MGRILRPVSKRVQLPKLLVLPHQRHICLKLLPLRPAPQSMHLHGFRARVALWSISNCQYHHSRKIKFSRNLATSTTGLSPWSMQKQVVDALCSGERKKASDLLLDFGYRSRSLKADDFVGILNYCARSPDPLFVVEIWRLMELKDVSMNNICSSLMMEALCKGGYLDEAFNLMDFLGVSQHLRPLLPLYNILLRSCVESKSIIQASKCLELMEKQMVGKNEATYSELLKLAVLQRSLPTALLIWQEYNKHHSKSIIALHKFIWTFIRLGDLKSAYEALQQMVSLPMTGNIAGTVYGKFYSTILDIPVPSNKKLGPTMLDFMGDKQLDSCIHPSIMYLPDAISASIEKGQPGVRKGVQPLGLAHQTISTGNKKVKIAKLDELSRRKHLQLMKVLRWSFNDVIHGCAKEKNYMLAKKLIVQMKILGVKPSSCTYDGIIQAASFQSNFRDGLGVLKIMQQENLKPLNSTLATLSVICSKALQLDLAESFLDRISECLSPHPYNALLASCNVLNQPERAVQVFAKMKQIKLLPDIRTYELLFSLFGFVNSPYEHSNMLSQLHVAKRINAIERDMANNGVQHSHLSMKNLLNALGEERMIRELIEYFYVAEKLFVYGNPSLATDIYNVVLHHLVEAQKGQIAINIFKRMKLCGYHPDSETYNIMVDCCSILRSYKSASLLISMMIRQGFSPVTCTYTALIKILLQDEKFNEALNLLERTRLDGIQLDVLLFNTFLRQACYKRRIDIIELIVEYMHQEKVRPNPVTCGYVFSAYVNSGFHNTAIEALQVLSLRMMSEDGNILREKRRFVDEFILAEDSAAESDILVKLFEDSEDEFAVGLLNLRWCAVLGFPVCESADQSLWAKRIELQFHKRRLKESNYNSFKG
ncbi:pentatricopeptide repeat-containing protein At1g76280 isoform X2 [Lotus japonicus]|uniref:pentatricopeptide repeat-containing protein At1g76280 isoform X2 n=1 Tax=Lotus japonicus TaxID=34305 RepID=UPI0025878E97|nr:pentatricopeptide repeat-containing protein At1g76280 isoform X2 [Lotus japonicus]